MTVLAESPAMRAVRAGVFASSSVVLAVAAHRLGGGMPPSRWVLVIAVSTLFALGLVRSRRERGGPAITAVVLGTQLAMHAAFGALAMRSTPDDRAGAELNRWTAMLLCHTAANPVTAAQVDAARGSIGLGPLPTASPPAMHMAGPFTAGGGAMLAMHLIAALVMAWWLRRGERAVWAAARRVVRVVLTVARIGSARFAAGAAVRVAGTAWAPRRWIWGTGLAGRGPPAGIVAVRRPLIACA